MDQDFSSSNYDDLARREEEIIAEHSALYKPCPYLRVFYPPRNGRWRVDSDFEEGYYESAKSLLAGVVEGNLREGVEGPVAVFLSRHYLELAIKYALFHSRWLKQRAPDEPSRNTHDNEVEAVEPEHNLRCLWAILWLELNKRAPDLIATRLDLGFLESFVNEFHQIDKSGTRFRYPKKLAVASANEARAASLGIRFEALLHDLQRAHGILNALDSHLVVQYGLNQDWEAELNGL